MEKQAHKYVTVAYELYVDEAYGPYVQEHVLELAKEIFCVDGRFDKNAIYPGSVIPLVNADGNRFEGLVLEVKEDKVVVDLNHPLSGKALHFRGSVVTSREATDAEIQGLINRMSGEGCSCGGCGGGCESGCGGHHHEKEGCEGHQHGEGGCNGGHQHEGGCCGSGHCH